MLNRWLVLVFSVFVWTACRNDKADAIAPKQGCTKVLPDSVSFKNNIIPILKNNCSIVGCHVGGSPTGKLNLDSLHAYTSLTKSGSGYIDIVTPTNSILYISLISQSNPMPPTGNLDPCSVDLILKWIQQKAKNN